MQISEADKMVLIGFHGLIIIKLIFADDVVEDEGCHYRGDGKRHIKAVVDSDIPFLQHFGKKQQHRNAHNHIGT